MRAEGLELGLELHDGAPEHCGQAVARRSRDGLEQAGHPLGIEAIGLAVDRALGDTRLLGPLGWGRAEQHDWADQLVADLLRPGELEL
jgi:hypothetical protein